MVTKTEDSIEFKKKLIQDTLYVINGKWKLPILMAMHLGLSQFNEIKINLKGISSKVLSQQLKELEMNFLIKKTHNNYFDERFEYLLTEYAWSLKPMIDEMLKWGAEHRAIIMPNSHKKLFI